MKFSAYSEIFAALYKKCQMIQQLPHYPSDKYAYFSGVELCEDGIEILTGRADDIDKREFFSWEDLNKTLEEIDNSYKVKRQEEILKMEQAKEIKEALNLQQRKEQYLKLKKEFENE